MMMTVRIKATDAKNQHLGMCRQWFNSSRGDIDAFQAMLGIILLTNPMILDSSGRPSSNAT